MTTLIARLGNTQFPRTTYPESPEHIIHTLTAAHEHEGLRVQHRHLTRTTTELVISLRDGRRVGRYLVRGR